MNAVKEEKEVQFISNLSGSEIRKIREYLGQSLSEFGLTLKREIDPKEKRGFSRQYISALENGKEGFCVTKEIEAAIWNLQTAIDDVPVGIGGAVSVPILAFPNQIPEGSYLPRTAVAVRCARPGCPVVFVKTHPSMRFHDSSCARLWKRERRRL